MRAVFDSHETQSSNLEAIFGVVVEILREAAVVRCRRKVPRQVQQHGRNDIINGIETRVKGSCNGIRTFLLPPFES